MSLPVIPSHNLETAKNVIISGKQLLKRKLITLRNKIIIMGSSNSKNGSVVNAPPATPTSGPISNKLALGAGCYWGTEKYVVKDFQKLFPNSIKKVRVGFMSPHEKPKIARPNYQQVCSGQSGHVEVLYVELHEPEKHFEELVRFFFQFHDFTTADRQGNDSGFQYGSWIFCDDDEQKRIADKVIDELQQVLDVKGLPAFAVSGNKVTTRVSPGPLKPFTEAQAAHQEYLAKNPMGYCNHRIRFKHWLQVKEEKAVE